MAESDGSAEIEENTGQDVVEPPGRGPSWLMLLSGIGAVAVSLGIGFGLFGAVGDAAAASSVDGRWWFVAVTVVVGLVLVIGPRRRRDDH